MITYLLKGFIVSIPLQPEEFKAIIYDIAYKYHNNCAQYDLDDLAQEGWLALVLAQNKAKEQEIKYFKTYVYTSAKGAVLQYLRHNKANNAKDWSFNKMRREAINHLQSRLFREPTNTEIANYLDMDLNRYHAFFTRATSRNQHADSDDEAIIAETKSGGGVFEEVYLQRFLDEFIKKFGKSSEAQQIEFELWLNGEGSAVNSRYSAGRGRRYFEREMFEYNPNKDMLAKLLMRNVTEHQALIIKRCKNIDFEELLMYLKPLVYAVLPKHERVAFDETWSDVTRETLTPYLKNVVHPHSENNRLEREIKAALEKGHGNEKIKCNVFQATPKEINRVRKKYGFPDAPKGSVSKLNYTYQDIHKYIKRGFTHNEIQIAIGARTHEISQCFKDFNA